MQTITRKGSFDSMHRVMNEKMKCFNVHGHTYLYELSFGFENMERIGYAIDFKEIKRVACQFIDDYFDHAAILNPKDELMLETCDKLKSKVWLMSLNGAYEYCNPTVENIAKEVLMSVEAIMLPYKGLYLKKVTIYETPNCFTELEAISIPGNERKNFYAAREEMLKDYSIRMGVVEYDDFNDK